MNYTLTFDPGTDDDDLKDAIENTARLKQDEGKPVSGDLAVVIKARDDRDRILAALYEKARYGGVVNVTVAGQIRFPAAQPRIQPERRHSGDNHRPARPGLHLFGDVAFAGDAEGRNPADYGLRPVRGPIPPSS